MKSVAQCKKEYKVAIVILNYLNYKDTIECVNSALQQTYKIEKIIIVDNGSDNCSMIRLKRHYKENAKVKVIALKNNVGFARGNNVGIDYARKKTKVDFVLVVNNDTKFIDNEYLDKLIKAYEPGVGIIGSQILLPSGYVQDRCSCMLNMRECMLDYLNKFSFQRGGSFDFQINSSDRVEVLHGCALLFTPAFFKYYRGFYPKTFLYHEEEILYLMCRCKSLRQKYVVTTTIFHKEDQSSKLSFSNDFIIKEKYQYQSYKYVLLWILKCRLLRKEIA